ncbi:MAG TPA: peptidylprolyl isomerase [Burkholderiaceae bacterium]|nr:peptidylprolyl isomerase [Burkholderiaceae bacterium]
MKPRRPSLRGLVLGLALVAPLAPAQLRAPVAPSGTPAPAAPAPAAPMALARPASPQLVDRVVAIVNDEAITERELTLRTEAIGRRLAGQRVQLPPEEELRRQVLERMIVDRAQVQFARDNGVRIDEAAIDRAIARIAADSGASVAQLRQRIESDGLSFATFRQEVASELTISRLRERQVDARVQVSEAEIDAFIAEQAAGPAEYNIAQLVVRVAEDAAPDAVERARGQAESLATAARAGADFERLAARAAAGTDAVTGGVIGMRPADRLPKLFVDAVAALKPGEVAPVVRSPAGFHVLRLLEMRGGGSNALAGAPVRQTRARHILVRVNELNPEADVQRRLAEIRERIEAGTVDFADMARQYSADGSASQGGDLGWIYPGDTVPEFERAMDALEPGRIAGPVRTNFGFHLIQVVDRRTDEASPERVRAAARAAVRERKAAEAYQEFVAQVRSRAYVVLRLDER